MTDQNTFMELVQNVTEIVKTAEVPMDEKEILAYFSDMDLDEEQKRLVLNYIATAEDREQEEQETEMNAEQEDDSEETKKSKVFQMYLEELSMLPSVGIEERRKLYQRLEAGEEDAIESISTAWLKKVLTIAEKYMEPRLNIEDLIQEGNMALFIKLQELIGNKLSDDVEEVLSTAVEEGMVAYCSEMTGARELENTLVGKIGLVHEAKKILSMDKGHEPTIEELAEYTKMSVEELTELQDFMN